MLDLFAGGVAALGLLLAVIYGVRFRAHPWDRYYPKLAWLRGGLYFCACYLISYWTGAMELLVNTPLVYPGQANDPRWLAATAGCLGFIVMAYAGVWSYFTPVFERKRNILISGLFGFLWGTSSGQLFLSVWVLAGLLPVPDWGAALVTFGVLAAYQPNWHNIYWDHYIAPEHDTPLTQVIKATCCHIPNLAIMLTYLTSYENYLIFVLAQVIACTSAGVGMRFPAPWAAPSRLNYAVRTAARIPRCTGYIPADPKSDPYTPFYPGWKARAAAAEPPAGRA